VLRLNDKTGKMEYFKQHSLLELDQKLDDCRQRSKQAIKKAQGLTVIFS
jgi:hypothetical protein